MSFRSHRAAAWIILCLAGHVGAQPRDRVRIWSDEPPLVRLARDHFGAELTAHDVRLFQAVAAGEWADFRPTEDTTFQVADPSSWDASPVIGADRLVWLCTNSAARRHIPPQGVWIRGAKIAQRLTLFRATIPFSLTFFDCLLADGFDLRHARIQELDIRNSCIAPIAGQSAQVDESILLIGSVVYGGCNFTDAQIGANFDAQGATLHSVLPDATPDPRTHALDLYDAQIQGDLLLNNGFESHGVTRLTGARVGRGIDADGGHFHNPEGLAWDGNLVQIGTSLFMRDGFEAEGQVRLVRARIHGDLDCDGGQFRSAPGTVCLHADGCEVEGEVYLGKGFAAEGEVRFVGAVIGGSLDCDNGYFSHPTGDALSFDSATIGHFARLSHQPMDAEDANEPFAAEGAVTMTAARIGRGLDCSSGIFDNPDGVAIAAQNIHVDGDVSLSEGFEAFGLVALGSAEVTGSLDCAAGQFETPAGEALHASYAKIGGSANLRIDFQAVGTVVFDSAHVGEHFDCRGSVFDGSRTPNQVALSAEGMKVGGHVFMNRVLGTDVTYDVRAVGSVNLQFAEIAMNWDCAGATFEHPDNDALEASDAVVGRHLIIAGTLIDGRASFSRSHVHGILVWQDIVHPDRVELDLRFADIWVIKDVRLDDWPAAGNLQIEGLVYDHFDDDSPLDVQQRLAWIRRQYPPPPSSAAEAAAPAPDIRTVAFAHDAPETSRPDRPLSEAPPPDLRPPARLAIRRYATQPFTQLAAVYKAIGQDENASRVLVARAERMGELAQPFSARGLWYQYLGRLIGYGYEPFRAVKIGLVIVVLGALVFALAGHRNLMTETKLAEHVVAQPPEAPCVSPGYHPFNPVVYSLDVFLPFIDLKQVCYWLPGVNPIHPGASRNCLLHLGPWRLRWSAMLRAYLWFQTLAGWTLTTLLAAAVTGIVKS